MGSKFELGDGSTDNTAAICKAILGDNEAFLRYEQWQEDYYREDKKWCRHLAFRPFMVRYQPEYTYVFNPFPQNESRIPTNALGLGYSHSDLRIKHYGYATKAQRLRSYNRHIALDPQGEYMKME